MKTQKLASPLHFTPSRGLVHHLFHDSMEIVSPGDSASSSSKKFYRSVTETTMVRPILPKQEEESSPISLPAIFGVLDSGPASSSPGRVVKRRCISSACLPCRRRKSKCDGASPACSTCKAVYQMECVYDSDSDRRRKSTGSALASSSKRNAEQQAQQQNSKSVPPNDGGSSSSNSHRSEDLVSMLRQASWPEVTVMIDYIRAHGTLQGYRTGDAADLEIGGTASTTGNEISVDSIISNQISQDIGVLEVDDVGTLRHFGRRSSLELIHASLSNQLLGPRNGCIHDWTTITDDKGFISELIYLYFGCHHPTHVMLSKFCFIGDWRNRRPKYCSSLLLNAILALGCHYCPRLEARGDPTDPCTSGAHFFAEAKRLLVEEENRPSITVAQALGLMSLHETGRGHDSSAWMYSGRAFRVALDLGLNLAARGLDTRCAVSATENEVRRVTFWGLFVLDKILSAQFGRVPQLLGNIIGIPKPGCYPALQEEPPPDQRNFSFPSPNLVQVVAEQYYHLAEILGDALVALHSPQAHFGIPELQNLDARLWRWENSQPAAYSPSNPKAGPAIITLHMLYHYTRILIFRPFTHLPFISARDHCTTAASALTNLFTTYSAYHTTAEVAFIAHILLVTASVFLEDPQTDPDMIEHCVRGMHRIATSWPTVAHQTLHAVQHHAELWSVSLPFKFHALLDETLLQQPPPYSIVTSTETSGLSSDGLNDVPRAFASADYTAEAQDATTEFMKTLESENWTPLAMPNDKVKTGITTNVTTTLDDDEAAEIAVMGLLAGDVGMGIVEGAFNF